VDLRRLVLLLAGVAVAIVVVGVGAGLLDGSTDAGGSPDRAAASTDPASGLPWVEEEDLPVEARDTLALIDAGGPYPYDQDDETFSNREGLLPDRPEGYYREYTVVTPGEDDRGPRRIVTGDEGEYYWTTDHYASFERIAR
jgi:ribonuclease T1